ncbi:ATP-binding protein [Peristeroidobacter soli]|uniref:ATP-binding protein n=1 Tax=Peristeroidobacter soli TaxID=2497877 RepID=UPI00101D2DF4|nr:ATP-binding protein [Peristeroidobacter soli]
MDLSFERRLVTDLRDIVALADDVARWGEAAGLAEATVFQVNLVLDELITNVIMHGLGVGQPGCIVVRMERAGDVLDIVLIDDARPFDPFSIAPPDLTADIERRPVGGLGVHLVRTLMDAWHYARMDGRNFVSLRKHLFARQSSDCP